MENVEKNKEGAGCNCPASIRILWVDDDAEIRALCKLFLNHLGYFYDFAESGREALELLRKNQYDLLITDITMPKMSGWQLVEEIGSQYPAMKIAVVSGLGKDVFNEKRNMVRVSCVMGKPIGIDDLSELIKKMCRLKD